ncbi:MAG TPA: hypothetical protein ENG99_00875 [bacterium]|nr:hypothetical protein [bacterium]
MKRIDFKKILWYFNLRSERGTNIKVLRDWKAAFFCLIFLFFLFSAADFYIFWSYSAKKTGFSGRSATSSEEMVRVDQKSLNDVLEKLNMKEQEFKKTLSSPGIKDPSL